MRFTGRTCWCTLCCRFIRMKNLYMKFKRYIFKKLNHPINILDWGADPIGNRDSAWSIQMAINEARYNRGIVIFPNGVYYIA